MIENGDQKVNGEECTSLKTVRLQNVFLHVTKACNLRCAYCYSSAGSAMSDEMTREEFDSLWPDMVSVRPRKVVFTGGEPLLRPDIRELLKGLQQSDPDHHVLRCLNTNGHLVTPRLCKDLVGIVDEMRVSIDALSDRNDALRGRGNFEAAMNALKSLHAIGFEPKALVTVTSISLPDLEELLCLLFQKKITRININSFRPIGRGRQHEDWLARQSEIKTIVASAWTRSFPDKTPPFEPPEMKPLCNCGVGRFLNIAPNGDVFPCHVLDRPEFRCGNLRRNRLPEICGSSGFLHHLGALDFRQLAHQDKRLSSLTEPHACMGDVYARTSDSPVWKDAIPLLGSRSKDGHL
jgi:MoaA/NifB/PqqE/SkfB family radical SAM enzyme